MEKFAKRNRRRFCVEQRCSPLVCCLEIALKIASKSTATVGFGKPAFYRQLERPLVEAYEYAAEVMVTNMLARDAEEGISAFIEKRHPSWTDS